MKFRAPDGLSYEERVRRKIRRPLGNSSGDFDEFTCAWNSMSGPKLTAGLLRRLTENADSGAASEQALLYRSMLEKEPAIAAHLQTRILSVLSCDWSLQGDDPAKVHELTGILEQAGIHRHSDTPEPPSSGRKAAKAFRLSGKSIRRTGHLTGQAIPR